MNANLDLKQLARQRPAAGVNHRGRLRRVAARYVVPGAIVLGFLAMLGWAARDRLLPARPVTVVPVVVTRAQVQQGGAPLFTAPGWIEPRPAPLLVSALAEGVIEELSVVEGEEVKSAQPVARLIDADARLALEQAQAQRQLREAEAAAARARLEAARQRMERPVHLEAALAEAESLLVKAQTELALVPSRTEAAEARLRLARQQYEGKQAAGEAVAGRVLRHSQTQVDLASSAVNELNRRGPGLEQEVQALTRRRDALRQQLELRTDEARELAEAQAGLAAAEARQRQAELAVDAARLRLERMVVRAPAAGRVLELLAGPGTRVMGLAPASRQDASTVVSLYDPAMLQVRADVRLEDVPLVEPGQPVRIETPSAPGPIEGEVLRATSRASVQKNTLEVKVAVKSPPLAIRPEMLVQVTFLAPKRPESASEDPRQRPERLLVPRQLVEQAGGSAAVWLAGADGVAHRRAVKLGRAGTEALVEVVEGLVATDKLICDGREGIEDGQRIRITGEDGALGTDAAAGAERGPPSPQPEGSTAAVDRRRGT